MKRFMAIIVLIIFFAPGVSLAELAKGSGTASDITYDPTTSGRTATDMQALGDELSAAISSVSTSGVDFSGIAATTDTTGIDARQMILENSGTTNRITWANIISAIKASLAGFFQPDDSDLDSLSSGITGPVLGLGNGSGYQALQLDSSLIQTSNTLGLNPTLDLSGYAITFGLEASDIPDISGTYATAGHDHSGVYEPSDTELSAIAALANAAGVLTNDGSGNMSWGAGGAAAYDDIADPDANASIAFGAYTGTYTSATDGWEGLYISNTAADNASATYLLTLEFNDDFDTNNIFLSCVNNADADADNIFEVTGLGVYIGAGTPGQTMTGDDLHVTGFLEVDETIHADGGVTLGGNMAVGANEIQSTGNIVFQLGDNAGTNKLSIQDSDGNEVYAIDSNGGESAAASATPSIIMRDSDCTDSDTNYSLGINATDTGSGTEDIDITEQIQINGTATTVRSVDADGNYTIGTTSIPVVASGSLVSTGLLTASTNIDVKNGSASSGLLKLFEDSDNGTDYMTVRASEDVATGRTIRFGCSVADVEAIGIELGNNDNTVSLVTETGVTSVDFGTIGINAGTINGLTKVVSITTCEGAHDGTGDAATLTDSGESLTVDAYIGMMIYNVTDGSSGLITDNDATTITATLSGGTDNDWDASDVWAVCPGPGQSGTVFFINAATTILHPATAGYTACYFSAGANIIKVDPQSASMTINFSDDGTYTDPGAGDEIDGDGTQGDFITILNSSATEAYSMGVNGSWADGGSD